jgi:hypothetical protein
MANKSKTRVLSNVKPDDLLFCTCCEQWKEAALSFSLSITRGGSSVKSYFNRCKSCMKLRDSLTKKGQKPTEEELKKAVQGGAVASPPVLLNTPGHKVRTPRNPDDLTDAEKQLRAAQRAVAKERGSREETEGYVYCIAQAAESDSAVKIGWAEDPDLRLGALQPGNPNELYVVGRVRGFLRDERAMHAKYIDQNILGEWFRPTPELLLEFAVSYREFIADKGYRARQALRERSAA